MKRLFLATVVLLMAVPVFPARADVSAEDVETARLALRRLAAELEGQVERYDEAVAEEELLRQKLVALTTGLTAAERELELARRLARQRVADMYMSAGAGNRVLVATGDMAALPARYAYLESVSQTDRDVVNRLEASRRDFERLQAEMDDALAAQAQVQAEMEDLLAAIYDRLEAANEEYLAVKAAFDEQEAERRRREWLATSTTTTSTMPVVTSSITTSSTGGTTSTSPAGDTTTTTAAPVTTTTTTTPPPPPPVSGTRVCPVDGATTFRDSWGEPRPGGRTHKGVDMMAPRWTPLVAIETGTIFQVKWNSAGGLGVYLLGESGGLWYYAHTQEAAAGISDGVAVVAGQTIAYVGDSGNASVTHVHFGWMPNADWVFANPFPVVNALCR